VFGLLFKVDEETEQIKHPKGQGGREAEQRPNEKQQRDG